MNKNSTNSISIGNLGEDFATLFLKEKGYQILERNYRWKRSEIDIIAKTKTTVVFIEVKLRNNLDYGHPEQYVNERKVELILRGAEQYVSTTNWAGPIRFDIISISGADQILHLEDAF